MLTKSGPSLDRTFAALGDQTRRDILSRLANGEATVRELSVPFSISAPAVSRHLRVLETAGLIVRRRDGQHRRCSLQPLPLQRASKWLESHRNFWNQSLDRLEEHLTANPTGSKKPRRYASDQKPRR